MLKLLIQICSGNNCVWFLKTHNTGADLFILCLSPSLANILLIYRLSNNYEYTLEMYYNSCIAHSQD